jgi:hypothetical protein
MIPFNNSSKPAKTGESEIDSNLRRSLDAWIYGKPSLMYIHAITIAKGANVGTTNKITQNEEAKDRMPERQFLAEFCKAPSIVLISVVKRFKILPMGVTSKKRAGALVNLSKRAMNKDRDACKLA